MGWLFCAETKEELVNRLIQDEKNDECRIQVIAHRVVGGQLWMVREYTANVQIEKWFTGRAAEPGDTFRLVCVALMRSEREYGHVCRWGYNELGEDMHPFYYSCPLRFLEMAPEVCPQWRALVREWHAEKRKVPAWKSWKTGDVVEVYEKRYTILSPRTSRGRVQRHVGWNVRRVSDGKLFRFDRYALKEGVVVESGGAP